jgi:predicted O-linked N-acetylglucosamine transferase (SPINDLY family)
MLAAWARVVAAVPGSRFLFVRPEGGSQAFVRNIRAHFAAQGVAPERVEFRAVSGTHMAQYNEIDIALDTFPQTGGTTTCEAAWMGVPTVTVAGAALFERLSHSILHNAGLGDLSTDSPEAFHAVAVALAADTDRLQALRSGLRDQLKAGPLGQTEAFARDFFDLITRAVAA